MPTALPTSFLGTQLDDRYRLDRLIGEGASAWVFAAYDARLDRAVAVKLLKPDENSRRAELQRRFVLEGQTLAKLVHPNVVPVYDAGVTRDGACFLVLELCEAGTLEVELFRRNALPAQEAVDLLFPLLAALACAHDRGIIHRDIKPANIVLAIENGQRRAKLLDFGIAKRADSGSTDSASGTPSYMAPEQATGRRPSAAADVWSLGVVFYRCLSGSLPFAGETHLLALQKLVNERAPRFADVCPGLPKHLAIALDHALERRPERRYADMRSFAQALASACAQDSIALTIWREPPGLAGASARASCAPVEITRPLEERERAAAAKARRTWPMSALWIVGAATTLLLGFLFMMDASRKTIHETPVARAQPSARAKELAAPVPERAAHRDQAEHVQSAPPAPAIVPSLTPTPRDPHPHVVEGRKPSRRPPLTSPRPRQLVPPAEPVRPAAATDLVTNWDW